MNRKILIIVFILGLSTAAQAGKGHNHDKQERSNHDHEKEDANLDHGKEEKKNVHHDHDEGENEGEKNVGPNKGVTSFDEEKGITLSEEARKKFSIETEMITGTGPWNLPESVLLLTGEEKNIYRYRDNAFKRIDVEIVKKAGGQIVLRSPELRNGDSIVVKGVGFIRTAEVDATSGESGHHH